MWNFVSNLHCLIITNNIFEYRLKKGHHAAILHLKIFSGGTYHKDFQHKKKKIRKLNCKNNWCLHGTDTTSGGGTNNPASVFSWVRVTPLVFCPLCCRSLFSLFLLVIAWYCLSDFALRLLIPPLVS